MRRLTSFIIVILTNCFTAVSLGQSQQSYEDLVKLGHAISDSLPSEAKHYFLRALQHTGNRSDAGISTVYNDLGDIFLVEANYDSSLLFFRKGLRAANQYKNIKEMIAAFQGIADDQRNLSQKDSSHYYLDKALALARQHHLPTEEAWVYNDLGNVYRDEDDLEKSLSNYIKAASLYDSIGEDKIGLSRAFSNIANVHYILRNYDRALDYVNQANVIAEKESYLKGVAYNHKLSGRIFRQKKELAKALSEYKLAWNTYEKLGDKYNMSETSLGIGNLRYDQGDYAGAIKDYKAGLELGRSIGVKSLMAYNYSALGYAMMELKQWKLSAEYMDSTIAAAIESQYIYLVRDAYEILATIEEEQGHPDKSLKYLWKYIGLKDSLTEAANRSAIEQAEAKYQNNRKSSEIEILRRDQQIQTAAVQRNRIIAVSIGVALVAVVMISILAVNRYRLMNKTKRQLELEQMRNQIARDLHDDIGSTLSSINIISQLALKDKTLAQASVPHLERIYDHSAKMMDSMSDIVWSINPENDSMEKVVARMKEFCGEILDPKEISYKFKHAELVPGLSLDVDSRKNLFLIFKEIVNNAAKYSDATEVNVVFGKDHQQWSMEISDNGRGFNRQTIPLGNGLNNITRRAEMMRAKIEIASEVDSGTRILLKRAIT
jgi:two-component system sensor histidine kinase UhpB